MELEASVTLVVSRLMKLDERCHWHLKGKLEIVPGLCNITIFYLLETRVRINNFIPRPLHRDHFPGSYGRNKLFSKLMWRKWIGFEFLCRKIKKFCSGHLENK